MSNILNDEIVGRHKNQGMGSESERRGLWLGNFWNKILSSLSPTYYCIYNLLLRCAQKISYIV